MQPAGKNAGAPADANASQIPSVAQEAIVTLQACRCDKICLGRTIPDVGLLVAPVGASQVGVELHVTGFPGHGVEAE